MPLSRRDLSAKKGLRPTEGAVTGFYLDTRVAPIRALGANHFTIK
jgi:hypothetical protein